MNGDYILDSNIIIDIFRGDQITINKISKLSNIYVPAIVLGELYYGAQKSSKTLKRILEIEQLEEKVVVLGLNSNTTKIYGEIKNELRKKGKPIPENDIWIAAITKESGLPLLTKDKHFNNVPGIKVEAMDMNEA